MGTPDAGSSGRRRWTVLARRVLVVVLLGAVVVALAAQWDAVRPSLGRLAWWAVLGAGVAVMAGIGATFLCWRAILGGLGARVPLPAAMRVFFLGQLGKYVPGSVWAAVAQVELAREYGVPRRTSSTTFLVFMLVVLGTGLAVAAPALPALGGADAVRRYGWTLLVLPLAVLALLPPVLNRAIAAVLRLLRRPPQPQPLAGRAIAAAVGWAVVSWLAYGLHVAVLAAVLGGPAGPELIVASTGAFAAAWCVGFLLVVAPAGAGVREVALVLLLAGTLSAPLATLLAVVSRILFTLGDLCWCLPTAIAARTRRRAAVPAVDPRPTGGGA